MELNKIRYSHLTRISDIFDIHYTHLLKYLHRMCFTEQQYRDKQVPLTLWSLRNLLSKTAFNWTIIICLLLSFFPSRFPLIAAFNLISKQTFGMEGRIDLFIGSYLATFVITEYVSLYSVWLQLAYRNTKLDVIYELRAELDRKLNCKTKQMLLNYFVRYSTLAGLLIKATAAGLVVFSVKLLLVALELFQKDAIHGLWSLILGIYCAIAVQVMFYNTIQMIFSLLVGLFLIVRVLHADMCRCVIMAKSTAAFNCEPLCRTLLSEYIHLHNLVLKYNRTVKEYIFGLDVGSKLITNTILIFTVRQQTDSANYFLYFFLALYSSAYIYDMLLHTKLAYFQTKNLVIHKCLTQFAIQQPAMKKKKVVRLFSGVEQDYRNRKKLQFHLKLNLTLIEFVADNRLGFTNGKLYLIDRSRLLEAFLFNIYMTLLLSKKI